MNCPECQDLLQRRLDGEAVADRDLEQHLAECPECRERHALAPRLLERIAARPRTSPPPDFAQRVVNRVLLERSLRWRRVALRLTVAGALAASLLFFFLLGFLGTPEKKDREQPPVAEKKQDVPVEQPESLAKSMEDAQSAVASLTGKLAEHTRKQAQMLLKAAPPVEVAPRTPPPMMADTLEPAADSLKQATQTVAQAAQGLEPVAQGARRAWAYFFREMPLFDLGKN